MIHKAAATVVSMCLWGCAMIPIKQPPKIKFDHPFVFIYMRQKMMLRLDVAAETEHIMKS